VAAKRKRKWKTSAELRNELREQDEQGSAPQPLAGCRSAAQKKAARRARQTKEEYRVTKRAQQITQTYRFAKRARETTDKYKAKKRLWENAPKAKLSRQQRKWTRFWSPCFFNWGVMRKKAARVQANNAAPYAPRFHRDGRISIFQQGVVRYLPCPDEPSPGLQSKTSEEKAKSKGADTKGDSTDKGVSWPVGGVITIGVYDSTGGLDVGGVHRNIKHFYPQAVIEQLSAAASPQGCAAPVLDRA
jgi:hypothetical protein